MTPEQAKSVLALVAKGYRKQPEPHTNQECRTAVRMALKTSVMYVRENGDTKGYVRLKSTL